MGISQDYTDVPQWVQKPPGEGYDGGSVVKYQDNIFNTTYWTPYTPGEAHFDEFGNPVHGWQLYDEMYDLTSDTPTEQAKIIAYIPTWIEDFDHSKEEMYQYITHGIISFLQFSEDNLGEFDPESLDKVNAILSDVVEIGHRKGTYISIALGGAEDYGFQNLMNAIGNNIEDPRLDAAVEKVVDFVNSNDLDGVDLDLECWWDSEGNLELDQGGRTEDDGPHPAGYALTFFAQKLKQAMPNKLVSAAVFSTSWYGNNYDPQMIDHLDWLGIMTYDFTGSWNESPVGPHSNCSKIYSADTADIRERDLYQESYLDEQQGEWPAGGPADDPIYSVEDSLWYWTNPFFLNWQGGGQEVPRNKIAGGVPLYGYDFAYEKEPNQDGIIPPGYKFMAYKDILDQFPGADTSPNGNIKISGSTPRPPFINADGDYQFANNIYFETPETAVAKLNFLKSVGTQGVIIWELSQDVWEDARSIIKALYQNSGNSLTRPPLNPTLEAVS